MQLDCETTSLDEVTLVSVRLDNDTAVDRRVRLRNRLDGPVMPPRTEGVPEAGWDDDGYETVVAANSTVAVGYACPAPECDPPVAVAVDERAVGDDGVQRSHPPSPEAVVRRLGRSEPPRDAVPTAGDDVGFDCSTAVASSSDRRGSSTPSDTSEESEDGADESPVAPAALDGAVPADSLADYLAATEARIDRAERLTDPSVSTATTVLAGLGGLEAVDGLQSAVDADAERLRALADRAEALAERAEATDVSLSALRRLA